MKENILLQKRAENVPYDQIGLEVKRTALACRLHYHQLLKDRPKYDLLPNQPEPEPVRVSAQKDLAAVDCWQQMPCTEHTSTTVRKSSADQDVPDLAKLSNIYRTHAGGFWGVVAFDYYGGPASSGRELETAFLTAVRSHATSYP